MYVNVFFSVNVFYHVCAFGQICKYVFKLVSLALCSLCSRCTVLLFFSLLLLCSDILNGKRRHFCGFPASRMAIPPFPSSLVSPADNRIQDRICSSCSAGLWKAHMNTSKLAGSSWSKSFHKLIWHNIFPGFYEAAHFLGSWQTHNWPRFAICLLYDVLAHWCLLSVHSVLSQVLRISGGISGVRWNRSRRMWGGCDL